MSSDADAIRCNDSTPHPLPPTLPEHHKENTLIFEQKNSPLFSAGTESFASLLSSLPARLSLSRSDCRPTCPPPCQAASHYINFSFDISTVCGWETFYVIRGLRHLTEIMWLVGHQSGSHRLEVLADAEWFRFLPNCVYGQCLDQIP